MPQLLLLRRKQALVGAIGDGLAFRQQGLGPKLPQQSDWSINLAEFRMAGGHSLKRWQMPVPADVAG